jgi:hypothetical protein
VISASKDIKSVNIHIPTSPLLMHQSFFNSFDTPRSEKRVFLQFDQKSDLHTQKQAG